MPQTQQVSQITVVRGAPAPEELAAAVVALLALARRRSSVAGPAGRPLRGAGWEPEGFGAPGAWNAGSKPRS
ncbi:acyl-CoA carboxylase epsilon subunit [Kitasatospora sp. NPDC101801]|uniref:acyl-CoA carboxylase epsilon subunit n=1 Tax=Kitasatospora sp. NPDC101801 TaxID=3364103 RepID=UPI00380926EB